MDPRGLGGWSDALGAGPADTGDLAQLRSAEPVQVEGGSSTVHLPAEGAWQDGYDSPQAAAMLIARELELRFWQDSVWHREAPAPYPELTTIAGLWPQLPPHFLAGELDTAWGTASTEGKRLLRLEKGAEIVYFDPTLDGRDHTHVVFGAQV